MPLNIDLHAHTFFSGDGVSSPEDLIAAARAKGLHGLAITDHNTCDAVNYLLEKGLMRLDGLPVGDRLGISYPQPRQTNQQACPSQEANIKH